MKIVHIIIGLNVGGAELMLKRLIESHFNNSEYEHLVVSLTDIGLVGRDLQQAGVNIIALGARGLLDVPRTYYRLCRGLRIVRPDIVQTWMYHADLLGGLAARAVGIRKIIWGVRTTDIKLGGSRVTRLIRKICAFLSRFVPAAIVCAASAAREIHERIGYDAKKMLVIYNGFQVEEFVANPAVRALVRAESGFTNDHIVVGSVGRFDKVKDQKNFVQAAGELASRHEKLRFLMVGRDLTVHNRHLMRWITETGFPERFILLGERSDVAACLSAMDVFCLHSRTEGFPNVVGEAMAIGRPCVVTNVGDAAFLVGNTGVIVPKEDPIALAEGIENLVSLSLSELNRLGASAQQRVHSFFTMSHARAQFERLYEEIVNRPGFRGVSDL